MAPTGFSGPLSTHLNLAVASVSGAVLHTPDRTFETGAGSSTYSLMR